MFSEYGFSINEPSNYWKTGHRDSWLWKDSRDNIDKVGEKENIWETKQ